MVDAAFTGAGDARLRSYGTFSNGTNDVGIDSGLIIAANADAASFATAAKANACRAPIDKIPHWRHCSPLSPDFARARPAPTTPPISSFSLVPGGDFIKFDYSLLSHEYWRMERLRVDGLRVPASRTDSVCSSTANPLQTTAPSVPSSGAYLTMKTAGIVAPQGNAAANRAAALATVAPNQKFAYAAQNPEWTVQFLTVPLTCVVDVTAQNTSQTPVNIRIVVADVNDGVSPPGGTSQGRVGALRTDGLAAVSPAWTDQTLGDHSGRHGVRRWRAAHRVTRLPTYSLSAGVLPTGLSLNDRSTGAITGTPTAAGAAYDFTITVANGNLPDLVKQFTGNVAVPPAWTDNTIAAPFQVGIAVNDGVAASGTPAPTYSISAGGLPAGLTLDTTTGAITGTPTTNGGYSFTLSAGNGIGAAVTQVFTGSVTTPPVWTDQALGAFQIDVAYSDGVSASGSPAPTYSLSAGVLPTGLSLNTATGEITGTPTAAGAFDFTITATNGSLPDVVKQFTGNVGVQPAWTDPSLGTMRVGVLYADGVERIGYSGSDVLDHRRAPARRVGRWTARLVRSPAHRRSQGSTTSRSRPPTAFSPISSCRSRALLSRRPHGPIKRSTMRSRSASS